ncbi:MAG TPA: hypothetical protein VL967_08700 [Terracidiphilus sp.]|nr:hypothetical protein [Terracidiphilus sp.]
MNTHDEDRIRQLLKQTLAPAPDTGPSRDLWPSILRRLDARPSPPWFDWALAAGLALFIALFPTAIPLFLYYL